MLSLFLIEELPNSGVVEIEGEEAKHAISALRVKVDEEISLTNGCGVKARGKVIQVGRKSLSVAIQETSYEAKNPIDLTVVQALTKGDRARETIELLTEAGVNRVIPWSAQRSIGVWKEDAFEKWVIWSKEATKQSRRSWLPEIEMLHNTNQVSAAISNYDLALIFEESSNQKLSTVLSEKNPNSVLIMIGPEGGITDAEAEAFKQAGAISVVMGNPVFRSAHAGAAALAAVQTGLNIW